MLPEVLAIIMEHGVHKCPRWLCCVVLLLTEQWEGVTPATGHLRAFTSIRGQAGGRWAVGSELHWACDSGDERVSDNKHTIPGVISWNKEAAVFQLSNNKATASPGVAVWGLVLLQIHPGHCPRSPCSHLCAPGTPQGALGRKVGRCRTFGAN